MCFLGFLKEGFLGGEYVDFQGSLQLLTSSHLRCGRVLNGTVSLGLPLLVI